ncbi:MAG: amino acid racemase [Thermaerobacter sp.]|nr:amino acid racemase [Thermaerobacter sp.]
MSKTLGILAGLGPLAGAHFYRRVIELTPSRSDDGHLSVVLMADRTVPSRLEHLAGRGPSPVPALTAMARRLVAAGAEVLAIPSSTTHAYYADIAASVPVPVLNLIDLVAREIGRRGAERVGIVATTPTRAVGLYDRALASRGIAAVYPDDPTQREIMAIIDGVKVAGHRGEWGRRLTAAMRAKWAEGTDGLVLACTETPVVFPRGESPEPPWPSPIFDASDILARAAIVACQHETPRGDGDIRS